jgi:ribosomal-protein-alanine N-acetyltransferase
VPKLVIAEREHLSAIAEIERLSLKEAWSESALELFVREGAFAVVCIDGGEVRSYCTVFEAPYEAQIINVATHPDFRGRGFAAATVRKVLEESRIRGAESVSLEVRSSNAAAIGLYESLGFSAVGRRRGFYKDPAEDAVVMIKKY